MDIQIGSAVPAANNPKPQQGSGVDVDRLTKAVTSTTDLQRTSTRNKKSEDNRPPSDEEVEKATDQVNKFVSAVNNDIQFSIDKETGISVVKVVDKTTNEIIRQIPGDEILQIAKTLDRLQGLFVKQQA